MYSNFTELILDVCKTLNESDVQFIIIGGTAAGFHGFNRMTLDEYGFPTTKYDFDFWYKPTYGNYFNIIKAMKALGKDTARLEREINPNPKKSFLRFNFEKFKIDFLPEVKGLSSFEKSLSNSRISVIDKIEFRILSLDDLIKTKETDSREKDKTDLEILRRLRDEGQNDKF